MWFMLFRGGRSLASRMELCILIHSANFSSDNLEVRDISPMPVRPEGIICLLCMDTSNQ